MHRLIVHIFGLLIFSSAMLVISPSAAHAATLYWVGGNGIDIQAGYTDTIHET